MGCVKTSINPDPWIRIPVLLNLASNGDPILVLFLTHRDAGTDPCTRAYRDRDRISWWGRNVPDQVCIWCGIWDHGSTGGSGVLDLVAILPWDPGSLDPTCYQVCHL